MDGVEFEGWGAHGAILSKAVAGRERRGSQPRPLTEFFAAMILFACACSSCSACDSASSLTCLASRGRMPLQSKACLLRKRLPGVWRRGYARQSLHLSITWLSRGRGVPCNCSIACSSTSRHALVVQGGSPHALCHQLNATEGVCVWCVCGGGGGGGGV
jgi:hypothetical protein